MRWRVLLMVLLCILARWSLVIQSRHVTTRSLGKFARMIKALTGRGPLEYNQYGNYCGFGGTGEPVDDIDRSDVARLTMTATHNCKAAVAFLTSHPTRSISQALL